MSAANCLIIPSGFTEHEVLTAIDRTVNILAPGFAFGFMDEDDIKQEGRLFAMEGLKHYDASRSLDAFLYTHVKNRLINLKRDKFRRNDPPCRVCHDTGRHPGSNQVCDKYNVWYKRNSAKASLCKPLTLNQSDDDAVPSCSSVVEDVSIREVLLRIDQELPVELRASYLQMKSGVSVPKALREKVESAVRHILREELEEEGTALHE